MNETPQPVTRKSITLPRELWQAVDDYRFSERIGSQAGAVRILLQVGLEARPKGRNPDDEQLSVALQLLTRGRGAI